MDYASYKLFLIKHNACTCQMISVIMKWLLSLVKYLWRLLGSNACNLTLTSTFQGMLSQSVSCFPNECSSDQTTSAGEWASEGEREGLSSPLAVWDARRGLSEEGGGGSSRRRVSPASAQFGLALRSWSIADDRKPIDRLLLQVRRCSSTIQTDLSGHASLILVWYIVLSVMSVHSTPQ